MALALLVALPAGGALLLYYFTGDPLLRPLGITQEKLADVEATPGKASIMVKVHWGIDQVNGPSKSDIRWRVSQAFRTNTDEYYFRFADTPGDQIGISFVIGANRYGPYPADRFINGMIVALEAQRMINKPSE